MAAHAGGSPAHRRALQRILWTREARAALSDRARRLDRRVRLLVPQNSHRRPLRGRLAPGAMAFTDGIYRVSSRRCIGACRPPRSPPRCEFTSCRPAPLSLCAQTFMRRNSIYFGFIIVGAFAGEKVRRPRRAAAALAVLAHRRPPCNPAAGRHLRRRLALGFEQQGEALQGHGEEPPGGGGVRRLRARARRSERLSMALTDRSAR